MKPELKSVKKMQNLRKVKIHRFKMYNIRWFSLELLWSKQPSYSLGKATHVEDRLPKEEMVIVYPTVFGEAITRAYLQK